MQHLKIIIKTGFSLIHLKIISGRLVIHALLQNKETHRCRKRKLHLDMMLIFPGTGQIPFLALGPALVA